MKPTFKNSLMFTLVILMMIVSAIGVTPALAQDETPPPPATSEVDQPPVEEPVVVEEPAAVEEPIVVEEPATTEEPAVVEEPTVAEEEPAIVAEALEQLPEDTALVVLDESGDALPLASQEAAEVVASADPYFWDTSLNDGEGGFVGYSTTGVCPEQVTVCNTVSSSPIQAAVDAFGDNPNAAGDIFVEADTYSDNVSINTKSGNFNSLTGLIGAGSESTTFNHLQIFGLTNPFTLQGFTFNGYVNIQTKNDVTVSDVVVDGDGSYWGLNIYSSGNVTLQDVESYQSSGDGAYVEAAGDISIYDSTFEENAYGGLYAYSDNGAVTLDGVTASNNMDGTGAGVEAAGDISIYDSTFDENTYSGLYAYSYDGSVTLDGVTASNNMDGVGADVEAAGDISVYDSTFEENAYSGLYVYSDNGTVTLDGVIASGNGANDEGASGASVYTNGNISIWDSTFEDNTSSGLYARSKSGSIMLDGVTANNNGDGASLRAGGDIQVFDSVFNDNIWYGLVARSYFGSVMLDGVTVSGGDEAGAFLTSSTTVDVYCSEFSSSYWGMYAGTPDLYLNGVTFSGNTNGDYENEGGNIWVNEYDCNPVPPVNPPVSQVTVEEGKAGPLFIVLAQTQDQLPGVLGSGNTFGSALKVELTDQGKNASHHMITLSFPIPDGMTNADLAVMFWNGSAWVEVPGGSVVGDMFVITVSTPGYYMLVSQ